MKTPTVWIAAAAAVALLAPAEARGDEVREAVTKLLAEQAGTLVIVEFDLERADGRGGREVTLQGTLVGPEGLILVTGAKEVDPPIGGEEEKPSGIKVRFPGDRKRDAEFVGKDEELNLALLRLAPEEKTEEPVPVTTARFDGEAAVVPGEQLVLLKRLGKADDDHTTFGLVRVAAVIPRPGLPTEIRLIGNLNGFAGCTAWSLDARLVGFVSGGERRGRGRGGRTIRIVNGRMVMGGGGGGGDGPPTRILPARTVVEFLSDPTKFARRDCWIGVSGLQALTKGLAEALGVEKPGGLVVGEVGEGGPAERAGLKPGDVLVAVDGEPLDVQKDRDIVSFQKTVRRSLPGATRELTVLRSAEAGYVTLKIAVTMEESPLTENEVSEYQDKVFGLDLKPLTRDFLTRSRLPLDTKGVRVTSVEPASWAFLAGVRAGDVIQKMVLKPCDDLDMYKEIIEGLMKTRDSEVCYNVLRQRKSLFVCVRPDWETIDK